VTAPAERGPPRQAEALHPHWGGIDLAYRALEEDLTGHGAKQCKMEKDSAQYRVRRFEQLGPPRSARRPVMRFATSGKLDYEFV